MAKVKIPPMVEWCENNIILDDGKLIKFEPHQREILNHVFTFDENGKLLYSTIVYSCIKKSGKTETNACTQAWFA